MELEVQESRSSMNFGWKSLDDYEEWGMGMGGGGRGKEKEKEKDGGRVPIHLDLDK